VKGAKRKGKTNEDEARFIVDEIAAIAHDPAHAKRDVAVISLIGGEQAELIQRRLMEDPRVGTETMERMRIVCGDSRTMQGQERSIVFLSMVASPGTAVLQGTREDGQRFNVALSRARDRLYLVHSVSRIDLKSGDLKLAVLDHFADPMPGGGGYAGTSVLDRCESGFEREVCGRLIEANYRVRSQVKAGPFSIDLVVEGADDRRLAIELDGDRWHGPDKWDEDMARQAVLERAGWTFWRVFGSQWISDRGYWWGNLVERLGVMGITPIGAQASDDIFTEYRVFDVTLGSEDQAGDGEVLAPAAGNREAIAGNLGELETNEPEQDEVGTAQHLAGSADDPEAGTSTAQQAGVITDPFALEREVRAPITSLTLQGTLDFEPTDIAHNFGARGEQTRSQADPSRFYDHSYRETLRLIAWEIIDGEGPITSKFLCERVARLHGFQRTGSEIKRTIQGTLKGTRTQTHGGGDDAVLWPKDRIASEWTPFRGLEINGATRGWADVPIPEKLGLARQILAQRLPEPETTMRETLGMARLRTSTRIEIQALLEKAQADLASELDRLDAAQRAAATPD